MKSCPAILKSQVNYLMNLFAKLTKIHYSQLQLSLQTQSSRQIFADILHHCNAMHWSIFEKKIKTHKMGENGRKRVKK